RSYDGAQYNNIYYMEGFGSTNSGSLKFFTRNASGTFQVLHLDFEGNIRVPSGNLGINSVDPDVELVVKQRQTPVASLGGLTIKPAGLKIADDDDDFWLQYVDTFNYLNFAYNGQLLAQMSSASGDLFTFSDIRLKKRIEYMSSILDKVLKLRPISYHYKHDQTDNLDIGFIAQEVELIFPELVSEVDGLKSLPYSKFAVLAIKAIQEQQEQIDQLQKMVLALQEKVDRMNDTEVGSK
ncbi:MAG: tail fiber domain-containing protein, partial [Saprospiraceae bacterium]|nr:tail fiber domain-containing protein [Saprospiraceae bacterium]